MLCKILSVNKDMLVSVLFIDVYLLCPLNPTVLHCNILRYIAYVILLTFSIAYPHSLNTAQPYT